MHKYVSLWLATVVAVAVLFGQVTVHAQEVVEVSSAASSAVLYEPSSGRVLFEQQAHVKRPMASTTKLMTALLAVETLPQDAVLTVNEQAVLVEGSSMGLQVGDTVSRDDLLYGLLLSSGNDAANVFALAMADSFEEFADKMNMRAAQLGMTNSLFVTPSGLDADGHGASAYDMALLASQVLKSELLAKICATKQATVCVGDRKVGLENHNRLLSMYEGTVGMKTGYTSKAGRCLVSAVTRNGVTLIAVTLDCADDWQEHMALFDAGFACMESVELQPSLPHECTVYGGNVDQLTLQVPTASVTVLSEDRDMLEQSVKLPPYVWAPIAAGETIGTVEYRLRGAVLTTLPITVVHEISAAPALTWGQKWIYTWNRLLKKALT